MRTIVIGGGISGLAAAYRLRERGLASELTLLEAGSRCGGHVHTVREDGFRIEAGPNGFLIRDGARRHHEPEPLALVRDLGLEGSLREARPEARRRFVLRGGKLRLVPGSPPALFTSDVLSVPGRLRVALEPMVPTAPFARSESVHGFAARRLGREAADVLVDAAVAGITAGESRSLDVSAAFPTLPEMEREHGSLFRALLAHRETPPRLVSPAGGMSEITDALVARLRPAIRLHSRVRQVVRAGDAWRVFVDDGPVLEADRVVVATAANRAGAMLRTYDPALAMSLGQFPQAGLAVVALAFRAEDVPHALDGYGYLAAREEGLDSLGVVWESSLFERRAPAGHVLLRVMLGGARRPAALDLDEPALIERARLELAPVLRITAAPLRAWAWRWPRAITQYTHGHCERVTRVRARAALAPGLELCGTSYDGVSFTAAIVSAERAVARLAASTSKESAPATEPARAPEPIEATTTAIARAD